jgi:hypothetical protein
MNTGARIDLTRKIARTLSEKEWSDMMLVLDMYGLPSVSGSTSTYYEYCIRRLRSASEGKLLDLDAYLHGTSGATAHDEPWTTEDLHLFLSHVTPHKVDAADLKLSLSRYGIEGFVAHEDIEPNKTWQRVIEAGLRSCHAMVVLLHKGFHESNWCDQEVGFALARKIPVIPLRFDLQPYGFLGEIQSLPATNKSAGRLAFDVTRVLLRDARTGTLLTDRMVKALTEAASFKQANATANLLASDAPEVRPDQLRSIRDAQETNDQVAGAFDVEPSLVKIEQKFGITAQTTSDVDQLMQDFAYDPSEEPF